jgi:HJR/Mrr/RecB family endonuclease
VPRSEFVGEMFDRLLGDRARGPSVEGYADRGIERLLEDIEAHHQRVRTHLAEGDVGAARGAAATVDALADEGERLADRADSQDAGQRVARHRWLARRAVVAAELGVDADALDGALTPTLKALLQDVDPFEFERLVAALWDELGYQTTVTQSSKDKGVDVVARQSTPVEQTVVIQAKRYGPNTKVGREEVQQYASLHRQEPDADLVVVVTTGAFTGPAMEAAGDLDVKLVDGDRLVEILAERDLYGLVATYVSG